MHRTYVVCFICLNNLRIKCERKKIDIPLLLRVVVIFFHSFFFNIPNKYTHKKVFI